MAFPVRLVRKFGSLGRPSMDRPKSKPMDKPSVAARGGHGGKHCKEEILPSRHERTEITRGDKAARMMGRYGKHG